MGNLLKIFEISLKLIALQYTRNNVETWDESENIFTIIRK